MRDGYVKITPSFFGTCVMIDEEFCIRAIQQSSKFIIGGESCVAGLGSDIILPIVSIAFIGRLDHLKRKLRAMSHGCRGPPRFPPYTMRLQAWFRRHLLPTAAGTYRTSRPKEYPRISMSLFRRQRYEIRWFFLIISIAKYGIFSLRRNAPLI